MLNKNVNVGGTTKLDTGESLQIAKQNIPLVVDGSSGSAYIEQRMACLLSEMFEIFKKKQASYGKGNIAKFGEKGVLIRMNDKMERLINLIWNNKDNPLDDESIDDTLFDLADYCFIYMLVNSGDWDRI